MRYKIRQLAAMGLLLALLPCTTLAVSFPDVDGNAAYAEAVEYVSEAGIMEGKNGGNFDPEGTVTRAEMAAIVCRMLYETKNLPSEERFSDVPVSHWANGYVSRAAELGIVKGYDDGNFGPSDTVTYEQAVTMIVRALGGEAEAESYGGYPDGYIKVVKEYGYLEGIDSEKGEAFLRSDIAILVYNCIGKE